MRYSDRVSFVTETEGGFNPETGNYDESKKECDTKPCNISPIGIKRSVELFGEVDTSIIVVRLQRPYHAEFDYIEVPSGQYKGDYRVKEKVLHRKQTVFYLEGVSV